MEVYPKSKVQGLKCVLQDFTGICAYISKHSDILAKYSHFAGIPYAIVGDPWVGSGVCYSNLTTIVPPVANGG